MTVLIDIDDVTDRKPADRVSKNEMIHGVDCHTRLLDALIISKHLCTRDKRCIRTLIQYFHGVIKQLTWHSEILVTIPEVIDSSMINLGDRMAHFTASNYSRIFVLPLKPASELN